MYFTIDTENGIGLRIERRVEEAARALSFAFPEEIIWVVACDRPRLAYLNGRKIEDNTDLTQVDGYDEMVDGMPEVVRWKLRQQWQYLSTEAIDLSEYSALDLHFFFESAKEKFESWTAYLPSGAPVDDDLT